MVKQFNITSLRIETSQPKKSFKKVVHRPPLDLLNYTQTKRHTKSRKASFRRRHKNVQNCPQPAGQASHLKKDIRIQNAASFLFPFIPLTTSLLLHCQSPSTVRERLILLRHRGSPGSNKPTTRSHVFPGTEYPGQCDNLTPSSQTPNPPGREAPCHQTHTAR